MDVTEERLGWEVLGELGKNRFGHVMRRATPTTLVGVKIIRGADMDAIRQAIADQQDWVDSLDE